MTKQSNVYSKTEKKRVLFCQRFQKNYKGIVRIFFRVETVLYYLENVEIKMKLVVKI